MPRGRPKTVSQEQLYEVCTSIGEGKALRAACALAGISVQTFCRYLIIDPDLRDHYARSRECRAHDNVDMIQEIAGRVLTGTISPDKGRVAIDALKWTASHWNRREYGEKTTVELPHSGDEALNLENLTESELDAFQRLLDKASGRGLPSPESP